MYVIHGRLIRNNQPIVGIYVAHREECLVAYAAEALDLLCKTEGIPGDGLGDLLYPPTLDYPELLMSPFRMIKEDTVIVHDGSGWWSGTSDEVSWTSGQDFGLYKEMVLGSISPSETPTSPDPGSPEMTKELTLEDLMEAIETLQERVEDFEYNVLASFGYTDDQIAVLQGDLSDMDMEELEDFIVEDSEDSEDDEDLDMETWWPVEPEGTVYIDNCEYYFDDLAWVCYDYENAVFLEHRSGSQTSIEWDEGSVVVFELPEC